MPPGHPTWETGPHQKEEEFARSLALALFDYLRKSQLARLRRFTQRRRRLFDRRGSGPFARAIGRTRNWFFKSDWQTAPLAIAGNRVDRRPRPRGCLPGYRGTASYVRVPIHAQQRQPRRSTRPRPSPTPSAPSSSSGTSTRWSMTTSAQSRQAIGRELTWERDDVSLQNIQARARGPGIWLLANLRNALLLTTSNRSEAAVGYATMDGDTCGGLAPIAGIDKAFLLDWLKWMERHRPRRHRTARQLFRPSPAAAHRRAAPVV